MNKQVKFFIIQSIEKELQPKTIECKNWSQWRGLVEKWTEDIKNWEASSDEPPFVPTDEDLNETVNELFTERGNIIPALEYIGKAFEGFDNEQLEHGLDATIVNYLTDLEEYFLEAPEQRGPLPHHARAGREIYSQFSPVDSMLTYWLDNAVRGMIQQLLEPINFYIEENPQHENFRGLAVKYVELLQKK